MNSATRSQVAEEEQLRANLYNFLGLILARPPEALVLARVAAFVGGDSSLGKAIQELAEAAGKIEPKSVEREYNRLFIGLGRGELLPYASYYMTGFLHEKPLALLRQDMARQGLERAKNVFEPEDNIASLMEMMGALIEGRFGEAAGVRAQKALFSKHIAPWAGHFFADLERAKNASFYVPVGTVGSLFMEIETEAFRLVG